MVFLWLIYLFYKGLLLATTTCTYERMQKKKILFIPGWRYLILYLGWGELLKTFSWTVTLELDQCWC